MKPWTKKEDKHLAEHYAWKGARYVSDLLSRIGHPRSVAAVHLRAKRIGLDGYEPKGYVKLRDLVGGNVNPGHVAFKRAKRDGVLERCNRSAIVPEDWADAFMDEWTRELDKVRDTVGWIGFHEICAKTGIKYTTAIAQFKEGRGIGKVLAKYPHAQVQTPTRRWVFHPDVLEVLYAKR